jgi:hypothetical protein
MSDVHHADTSKSALANEALRAVEARYEQCRPADTFADLNNRARFSKEDRRLLEDWLAAVAMGVH